MRPSRRALVTHHRSAANTRPRLSSAVAIATLFAVPAVAQTGNPAAPAATTGAATNITLTTATVPGTVDANGSATTYHVEYGTTTSYGLKTADRSVGSGDSPVAVSVKLSGLTSDTNYHFRVVASNGAGTGRGADRALRTGRTLKPQPPSIRTGTVRDLTPRSVRLTGSVNPRGRTTRYHFEYGTGTSLNRRTALVSAGAGTATVPASAAVTLSPNTRYSYRLVATNSAGTARGARRSFTSPRAPAALTFALESNRVPYGGAIVATGTATSAGVGGVPLGLERQLFPFSGAFAQVATQRSASNGAYRFSFSPLLLSARFRVVARTTPTVTSVAKKVRATVLVGLTATRRRHRRLRFSGEVRPELSGARASLQRRAHGHFVTLRRKAVSHLGNGRSSYRITIAARRKATVYRVIVRPARSSGYARGTSRTKRVAGRR